MNHLIYYYKDKYRCFLKKNVKKRYFLITKHYIQNLLNVSISLVSVQTLSHNITHNICRRAHTYMDTHTHTHLEGILGLVPFNNFVIEVKWATKIRKFSSESCSLFSKFKHFTKFWKDNLKIKLFKSYVIIVIFYFKSTFSIFTDYNYKEFVLALFKVCY